MESQIRPYAATDLAVVQRLHDTSQIDYQLPDLSSPLFLVTKVVEVDGVIRAVGGLYLQVECYLWMDRTDWASPHERMEIIRLLEEACMREAWLQGVDCACLWLPPGMDRFGDRLVQYLGFTRDRDGWVSYSKGTKCE